MVPQACSFGFLLPEARGALHARLTHSLFFFLQSSRPRPRQIALLALPFGEFVESVTPDEWLRRLQDASFRPVLPTSLPPQIRLAIKQGWASDPTKRCSSADLVKVLESTLGLPPSEEY